MEDDEEGEVLLTVGAPTDPLVTSDLPKVPKSNEEREPMLRNLEDPLFKAEDPLLLLEVMPFS